MGVNLSAAVRTEVIRTRRLDLEPLRVAHAPEMSEVMADPELHEFTGGRPATAGELRTRYGEMLTGPPGPGVSWCNWVLRLREDDCLTGTVQATLAPTGRGLTAQAEVAWVVGTRWQRRGIATEAAHALVQWLWRQPVSVIAAHVHPAHHASAAVAAACGLWPTDRWQDGEIRWEALQGRPQ